MLVESLLSTWKETIRRVLGLSMEVVTFSAEAPTSGVSFSDWLVLWMVLWGVALHAMLAIWLLWRVFCQGQPLQETWRAPRVIRAQEGRRWAEGLNGVHLHREELAPRETHKGLAGLIRLRKHHY